MNVSIITFEQSDLASRNLARQKREQVSQLIDDQKLIVLDFSGVENISGSYADELFGVLAVSLGKENLLRQLRIRECSDYCLQIIAESINLRATSKHQAA